MVMYEQESQLTHTGLILSVLLLYYFFPPRRGDR